MYHVHINGLPGILFLFAMTAQGGLSLWLYTFLYMYHVDSKPHELLQLILLKQITSKVCWSLRMCTCSIKVDQSDGFGSTW